MNGKAKCGCEWLPGQRHLDGNPDTRCPVAWQLWNQAGSVHQYVLLCRATIFDYEEAACAYRLHVDRAEVEVRGASDGQMAKCR